MSEQKKLSAADRVVSAWCDWIHSDEDFRELTQVLRDAADAEIQPLIEIISRLEWGNEYFDRESGVDGTLYNLCPACDQSSERGHSPDCPVGLTLARARGEQE